MKRPSLTGIDRTAPMVDVSDEVLARVHAANPGASDEDALTLHDELIERMNLL